MDSINEYRRPKDHGDGSWENLIGEIWKKLSDSADFLRKEIFEGQEVAVSGFADIYKDFNHLQGDNPFDFQGTCGLVSCEDVLNQYGIEVSETDIVSHAIENDQCDISGNPEFSGGTTPFEQAQILRDYGVDASVVLMENVSDLARAIDSDRSVIIGVNAGVLWNDGKSFGTGHANHAIVVTGVVRESDGNNIKGFFINDSGTGQSKQFVDCGQMEKCWVSRGGLAVETMDPHPKPTLN